MTYWVAIITGLLGTILIAEVLGRRVPEWVALLGVAAVFVAAFLLGRLYERAPR